MKYRVNWTENVGYYVDVEASSKEEALEIFNSGSFEDGTMGAPEPDGFCEVEQDSIEVQEVKEGE